MFSNFRSISRSGNVAGVCSEELKEYYRVTKPKIIRDTWPEGLLSVVSDAKLLKESCHLFRASNLFKLLVLSLLKYCSTVYELPCF
jgi:hypothetical protein